MNASDLLKKILMLHFLKLVNYERKRKTNKVDFQDKIMNLRRSSIIAQLAVNYFYKNKEKFIGKSEKYAAKEIKKFCRARGYRQGFPLIVGSGENTSKIHARPSDRIIQEDDIVMIDIGLKRTSHYFSDYCSDMTRTIFLEEPTEFQRDIYNIVQEAHELALKRLRPGISGWVLHMLVSRYLQNLGYKIPHGLGHSTRRYCHASPFLSNLDRNSVLKVNDHVTIEPGIYLKKGDRNLPDGHSPFGIRIEDLVIVREDRKITLS